jgi:hypothetical protein
MSREELYALVWSKPMRVAAKERGISDVALAKQCRRANVPVPPRGYWNKVQAGKKGVPQPLPPFPALAGAIQLSRLFPAYQAGLEPLSDGDLRRPEFEDIGEITRRFQTLVGDLRVPTRLTSPHAIVAKLLKQDEERRAKVSPNSFSYDYYGPKFDRPIQQRRLRLLSSLAIALETLQAKVHGSTHAGERFSIELRKGLWVYILLAVENGPHGGPFYRERRRAPQTGERLRLDITGHSPEHESPSRTWRDDAVPLENHLSEIIVGILLKAEEDTRRSAIQSYEWKVEDRVRKAKEARAALQRAEAERAAQVIAAAKARLTALMDGADALDRADRIRRYVASVRERAIAHSEAINTASLERWATWALAEADAIDPVLSLRFEQDLLMHDG